MNKRWLLLLGMWVGAAAGQDYAREERLAAEIEAALVVGDAVRIAGENQRPFLGLYTRAAPNNAPALLLLHGRGVHPEFGIVGQLRSRLADLGYTTLAIQLPVLSNTAPAADYRKLHNVAGQRLQAATTWLRQQGHPDAIPVAHSLGATMAAAALNAGRLQPRCWVAIGFLETRLPKLPALDLIAEHDFAEVLKAAPGRNAKHIRQVKVTGADHYFGSHAAQVSQEIQRYLSHDCPAG